MLLEVKPQDLKTALAGMKAMQFKGMNFTIPHKVAVLDYLDEIGPSASIIGAVNTLRFEGERLIGENTGWLISLAEAGINPNGKKVSILGAVYGEMTAVELALAGAKHLNIINRNLARGQPLSDLINDKTLSQLNICLGMSNMWIDIWSMPPRLVILMRVSPTLTKQPSGRHTGLDIPNPNSFF
ncbi:MAG: hypothetical protein R2865_04510 [Deinococcales bacterium]